MSTAVHNVADAERGNATSLLPTAAAADFLEGDGVGSGRHRKRWGDRAGPPKPPVATLQRGLNDRIVRGAKRVSRLPKRSALTPRRRPLTLLDHVMINPLRHQPPRLVHGRLRMMNAIQRRAALKRRHVVRPTAAQFAVGRHHRPLASPVDFRHQRLQLRIALNTDPV